VAESDEEILTLDVSDDALERAAPVVGGQATVTLGVWYCHRGQLRLGPAHFFHLASVGNFALLSRVGSACSRGH